MFILTSAPDDFYIHGTTVLETDGLVPDTIPTVQEGTSKWVMVPI